MLKKILKAIFFLFLIFLTASLFIPAKWTVQKSIAINAPAEKIFPYLNTLNRWEEWSPWNKEEYDPTMTYRFEGAENGVGAKQIWEGKKGNGILTIVKSVPNQSIEYHLEMEEGQYELNGGFELHSSTNTTTVFWKCWGDSGFNPIEKYMMLVFSPLISSEFGKGLKKLKLKVEHEQ